VSGPEWTKRAAAAVDQACDKLKLVPPDDHAQWASVAREAAGVYAAWSRRVEGDRPGPLAGPPTPWHARPRWPRRRPPRCAHPSAATGGGHGGGPGQLRFEDRGTGWAMLLAQMNRTLRLLAQVHEARVSSARPNSSGRSVKTSRQSESGAEWRLTRRATKANEVRDRPEGQRGPRCPRRRPQRPVVAAGRAPRPAGAGRPLRSFWRRRQVLSAPGR